MTRLMEDRADVASLHNLAGIHDAHPVAELGDDAQMVGDEEDGAADLALQGFQELDRGELQGGVQRRRRLVGDQKLGLRHQGHGDDDALAHAAREFMRVLLQAALGIGQAHTAQHLDGAGALGRLAAGAPVLDVHHLPADGEHRIEGRHGVLEHHGDPLPAQPAHGIGVERQQILAGERDAPALDHGIGRHQPQDRLDEARLAAAALAHDADDLPGRHLERDVAQRAEHPLVGAVGEVETLDGKGRRRHQRLPARLGSKVSRSASPRKVKPSVVMTMGRPPEMTGQGDSRI